MGFLDVAFLPFRASLPITFLNSCGGGESLGTTTYVKTVVGVRKGMLPVKHLRSNKSSFVSVEFHGDHIAVTMMMHIWPPSVFGILSDL